MEGPGGQDAGGFRPSAVRHRQSGDHSDRMLILVGNRGWFSLVGIALILAWAVVWTFTATVPLRVTGNGILLRTGSGDSLQAVLYFAPDDGQRILPDMPVSVSPLGTAPEEDGCLEGTVDSISAFPLTPERIGAVIGDPGLAAGWASDGPMIQVFVGLLRDDGTVPGYRWSSRRGSGFPLREGILCTGTVVLEERRPVDLILPDRAGRTPLGD